MSTLTVLLPTPALATAPEYDYVLSADGLTVGSQGRVAPSLLPTATQTVAVVPAHAMSWHLVGLPPAIAKSVLSPRTDAARVRSIVSGVLEELLLDEPERLHFACFAAEPSEPAQGKLWIGVVDRAWLQGALQALHNIGQNISRIVAECTPTSAGASASWLVTCDLEPARLVVCSANGVAVMPLHSGASPWNPANASITDNALLYAEPAAVQRCERILGRQAQVQTRAQRLLQATESAWNLAQLEFSARPADRLRKQLAQGLQTVLYAPQWKLARWSAAALVVLQIVALNALAWKETQRITAQKSAVRAVLQDTFPEVGLIIDAPVQMQRQVSLLAQSRGAPSAVNFTAALAILSTQLPASAAPSGIELSGDTLLLSGMNLSTPEAQTLIQTLGTQGWVLRQQGTTPAQWQLRRKEAL